MRALTSLLLFSFFSFPINAKSNSLSLYLWEDTLSPRVIQSWEQESNSILELSHFDNDDERSLLMMKNVQLPFDIVVLDNVSAQIYGDLGSFENLSDLPNRKHNAPRWNQACGDYAIPYFWGSVGIAYRKDLIASPPVTWGEFVNPPPEFNKKIGMINDSVESLLPIFYSLNLSPLTEDTQQIEAAFPKFEAFSKQVLTFEYVLSYVRSQHEQSQLQMALAYSGDQHSLNRTFGRDIWGFTIPKGETYIWLDCLAVSSHSTNKKMAKAFLNYISDPEIAAKNAIDIKAATPNLSALKQVPDWYKNDASLFPSPERIKNSIIDSELSAENISLRTKIINHIVKNHEAQY